MALVRHGSKLTEFLLARPQSGSAECQVPIPFGIHRQIMRLRVYRPESPKLVADTDG